jgi:hypothetical protein
MRGLRYRVPEPVHLRTGRRIRPDVAVQQQRHLGGERARGERQVPRGGLVARGGGGLGASAGAVVALRLAGHVDVVRAHVVQEGHQVVGVAGGAEERRLAAEADHLDDDDGGVVAQCMGG